MTFHGFGGSPRDILPLTDVFDSLGIVHADLTLCGHGTKSRDLKNVRHDSWIRQAESTYDSLANLYEQIDLVGFSMGGAISLILASRRPVSRIVLISPYFRADKKWYYILRQETWAKILSGILPYIKKVKIGRINDPGGLERYDAYRIIPLKSVAELTEIGRLACKLGASAGSPTLWMHSTGDIVADYDLSREMFERIAADDKEFVRYSMSNHILLYDYDSENVIDRIIAFLSGRERN